MESSKHVKSDSGSSEESDHHQEQVKDDAGTTPKRSYGCNYCKRGFTNAQALGGHMNIHRKDRAKAKQNNQHHATNSSFSKPPNEDHHYVMPSRSCFRPMILGEQEKYYLGSEAQAANYHPPMVSCPNIYPQAIRNEGDFPSHRSSQFFSLNEERAGANLSLRIGSTHVEDRVDDQENGEVDLELRLGPDP